MTAAYLSTMIGDAARRMQERAGSRASYARLEARAGGEPDRLTEDEIAFVRARDSVYMASVTEDGWPYVQHRGGEPGFILVPDAGTLIFADYPGNRQYISIGNFAANDRVSLFFMDYPARRRLKIIGHARIVDHVTDGSGTAAAAERHIAIDVTAYDWNCPKYITPRFTAAELRPLIDELRGENQALRAELDRVRRGSAAG